MIPTDTSTAHPFTPSWRRDEEKPPIYYLRAGGVIERAQLEAELSGQYGAGRVYLADLYAAFRSGISAIVTDSADVEHLLDLVTREQDGETLEGDDRQTLVAARGVVAKHWPEYRELMAQQEMRREIVPILVFRRFCTGWDNLTEGEIPLERGKDKQITEAVLAQINPLEMMSAGNFGYSLLYPDASKRNFPLPSQSDVAPETSSGEASPVAGKSKAKSGRKTPASRSPRGSGPS